MQFASDIHRLLRADVMRLAVSLARPLAQWRRAFFLAIHKVGFSQADDAAEHTPHIETQQSMVSATF